jgi:rubrerythrin
MANPVPKDQASIRGQLESVANHYQALQDKVDDQAAQVKKHEDIRRNLHEVIDSRNEYIADLQGQLAKYRAMGVQVAAELRRAVKVTRDYPKSEWHPQAVIALASRLADIIGLPVAMEGLRPAVLRKARTQVRHGEMLCSCADCGTAFVFAGGPADSLLYCQKCRA